MFRYIKAGKAKKDVLEDIDNSSLQIVINLLKLMLFPDDSGLCNHWKVELYSSLYKIPYTKGKKNNYPKKEQILSYLHKGVDCRYKKLVKVASEYEFNLVVDEDFDIEMSKKVVDRYLDWLSTELSIDGIISRIDCYNTVDTLLDNYFDGVRSKNV